MKLVLFDVDGTLLTASGAGRRALDRALWDVYGTAGPIDAYDFRGGTDPQIVWDLLMVYGGERDIKLDLPSVSLRGHGEIEMPVVHGLVPGVVCDLRRPLRWR